jgi:hypothetical protein
MQNQTVDKTIAWLALLCGIAISSVAIWFSVAGLVAIFAAAAIPIIIMGTVLEIGKLVATVWLKFNWDRTPFLLKSYLLSAIIVLMFITSMGIFGYLSKAHIEQTMPTGDAFAQIQIIDSQIELQQDIISQAQQELNILNNQIQEYTDRGFVTRGVEARAAQAGERERLFNQISTSQSSIAELRSARAPYDQTVRTIEAEVGPLTYIAAVIYGDSIDSALLEQAVRWVIIIIIFVFDPLAVLLLLSSQITFINLRDKKKPDSAPVDINDNNSTTTLRPIINLQTIKHERVQQPNVDIPQTIPIESIDRSLEQPSTNQIAPENNSHVDQLVDYIEKQEYRPDPETTVIDWVAADNQLLAAASDQERAAMLMWKSQSQSNFLTQQYILLDEGTIKALPWTEYVNLSDQKKK